MKSNERENNYNKKGLCMPGFCTAKSPLKREIQVPVLG